MTEADANEWELYGKLRRDRPELFEREAGAGAIELLLDPELVQQAENAAAARVAPINGVPQTIKSGVVLQDPYFLGIRDPVRFPGGALGCYFRLAPTVPGAVAGVAALPMLQGSVVLVRHFRHAIGRYSLEVPRGFSQNDSPEEAITRELHEEIGGEVEELVDLGSLWPDNGVLTSTIRLFLARIRKVTEPERSEGVDALVRVSLRELEQMIADGLVSDGFSIACFARAKCRGLLD